MARFAGLVTRAILQVASIALLSRGTADLAAQAPLRVALVYAAGETNSPADWQRAARSAGGKISLAFFGVGAGVAPVESASSAWGSFDVVLVDAAADSTGGFARAVQRAIGTTRVIALTDSIAGVASPAAHPWLESYWSARSLANSTNLLRYVATRIAGRTDVDLPAPPHAIPAMALYHPNAAQTFASLADYQTWCRSRTPTCFVQTAPVVGLIFNIGSWTRGLQQHIDSLIVEIERRGATPLAVTTRGEVPYQRLLMDGDRPVVDVVLYQGERLDLKDRARGLAKARQLDVAILDVFSHPRSSPVELARDVTGLAPHLTANVVNAEQDGLIEPLIVAGRSVDSTSVGEPSPIDMQVRWRVERALAWARLRRSPPSSRKVVFTFWSEGAGKANVGGDPDDFLDVPGSLAALLPTLRAQGYDVGTDPLPDSEALARRMSREISNIGTWAPAELGQRVRDGLVSLLPESTYMNWYTTLPLERRREIEAMWGPPPGKVMVHVSATGARSLVIPHLRLGNISIAAHPDWGYLQSDQALLSAGALPPHHQYLAFFLWMSRGHRAHAWVSLFSNIVLQPGKMEGPFADDHIGLLLGSVPHIHPERLGANGGMGNKRKGLAQTVGWYNLVAPSRDIVRYGALRSLLSRRAVVRDSALLRATDAEIAAAADSLGLRSVLLEGTGPQTGDSVATRAIAYLASVDREQMPAGSKILGSGPLDALRADMAGGMLWSSGRQRFGDRDTMRTRLLAAARARLLDSLLLREALVRNSLPSDDSTVAWFARTNDYATRLDAAPREVGGLLEALDGRWLEPGPMEEPFRNPDVLPPGRALYNFDQRLIPTPEAERLGSQLAEQMIRQHRLTHADSAPTRIALVLWSGETAKSQGVNEAQVLHLLGTRAVRDAAGEVIDIALIPREELGRPRVDVLVTTSGVYRDHFQDKVALISKAVRLASASPEADNPVRRTTEAQLQVAARDTTQRRMLEQLAYARVFSPAPNAYSPGIQFLAKAGDSRGTEATMADLFLRRMSHAYGDSLLGISARRTFESQLNTLDAAVLSRSASVNSLLDNPMPAGFLGGLDMATRAVRGRGTALYVSQLKDPGNERVESVRQALVRELDTRYLNAEFLRDMKTHGYDGARNLMFATDQMELWDATSPEVVTTQEWSRVKQVYVDDSLQLGMDAFFDSANPFAQQVVLATLLGASDRGHWNATIEERRTVAARLARSVAVHGISCEAMLCRNDALTKSVIAALDGAPEAASLSRAYSGAIATATGRATPIIADAAPAAATTSAPSPTSAPQARAAARRAAAPATAAAASATPLPPIVRGRALESVSPSIARRSSAIRDWRLLLGPGATLLLLVGVGATREGRLMRIAHQRATSPSPQVR
jgi:cobaltochelatase CobN